MNYSQIYRQRHPTDNSDNNILNVLNILEPIHPKRNLEYPQWNTNVDQTPVVSEMWLGMWQKSTRDRNVSCEDMILFWSSDFYKNDCSFQFTMVPVGSRYKILFLKYTYDVPIYLQKKYCHSVRVHFLQSVAEVFYLFLFFLLVTLSCYVV